jgi:hypothetical protein
MDDLAFLAGVDPDEFRRMWSGLLGRCWHLGEDGRWRNRRLERERDDAASKSEQARANASARKRPLADASGGKQTQAPASARKRPSAIREAETEAEAESTPPLPPVGGGPGSTEGSPPSKRPLKPRPWEQLLPMIDSERLRDAWTAYHRYRAELGVKPWTNSTCQRNLAKATPEQLAAALLEAVDRGWQGVRIENWAPDGSPAGVSGKIRPEGQAEPSEHPWDREERLRRERLRSSPPPVPDGPPRGLRRLQGGA